MASIAEIRAQYPQYDDMSDEALARALHGKFYSDMPYEDFAGTIGLGAPAPNAAGKRDRAEPPVTAGGLAQQGAIGGARGIIGLPGIFGDLRDLGKAADRLIKEKTGIDTTLPFRNPFDVLPTSSELVEGAASAVRPSASLSDIVSGQAPKGPLDHEPQNVPEEYARTAGEFIPGILGPGGPLRKGLQVALPAVASETAGQATKGEWYEPYARFGAAVLGGGATLRGNVTKQIAKDAPTHDEVRAAAGAMYKQLRAAGVTYDANAYGQMLRQLDAKLKAEGLHDTDAPRSVSRLKDLAGYAGGSPDFSDLESIRKAAGRIANDNNPSTLSSDKFVAGLIIDHIDDFMLKSPFATNGTVSANQVGPLIKQAREMGRRNIIARDIEEMMRKAEAYPSGYESGLRNQVASYIKKKGATLTDEELNALQNIKGNVGANMVEAVGKLGFNFGKLASSATVLPSLVQGGILASGAWPAALAVGGLGTAARYASPHVRHGVANRAKNVVLAGRAAQKKGLLQVQSDMGRRGLLMAPPAIMQLRDDRAPPLPPIAVKKP